MQANRAVRAGGHKVQQVHEWGFELPGRRRHRAGRHARRPDRHGPARRLRLHRPAPARREPASPSILSCVTAPGRCIARESSRRGAWRGSFIVRPADRRPADAGLGRLRGRPRRQASRERDTGRSCPDGGGSRLHRRRRSRSPSRTSIPRPQVGVNLQQFPRYRYAQVFQTIDDGVVRISHGVWASGDFPDPISSDAVNVTAEFGALAPFVEDDALSWTKAVPDVQDGPRCRRANYNLIGDLGAIDVDLDSGPITIDVPGRGFLLRRHAPADGTRAPQGRPGISNPVPHTGTRAGTPAWQGWVESEEVSEALPDVPTAPELQRGVRRRAPRGADRDERLEVGIGAQGHDERVGLSGVAVPAEAAGPGPSSAHRRNERGALVGHALSR